MGEEWKADYNPELVLDSEGNGITQRPGEILSLSAKFRGRGWTKPTYEERVLIAARRFLARGVNDGQFLPNQPAYVEFKILFFNSGEGEWGTYKNRIFFVHVRDLIKEIREAATNEDYFPWRDRYVDLGLSDTEEMNGHLANAPTSGAGARLPNLQTPKSSNRKRTEARDDRKNSVEFIDVYEQAENEYWNNDFGGNGRNSGKGEG